MLPVGFEPTISEGEGPQTYTLHRAATGTGLVCLVRLIYFAEFCCIRGNLYNVVHLG